MLQTIPRTAPPHAPREVSPTAVRCDLISAMSSSLNQCNSMLPRVVRWMIPRANRSATSATTVACPADSAPREASPAACKSRAAAARKFLQSSRSACLLSWPVHLIELMASYLYGADGKNYLKLRHCAIKNHYSARWFDCGSCPDAELLDLSVEIHYVQRDPRASRRCEELRRQARSGLTWQGDL